MNALMEKWCWYTHAKYHVGAYHLDAIVWTCEKCGRMHVTGALGR